MIGTGEIVFNKRNSLKDLHLKMKDYAQIELAQKNYETNKVSGRSGDLLIDLGTYNNRNITIDFDLVTKDYYRDYNLVMMWLNNITDNRLIIDNSNRCYRVIMVTLGAIKQVNYCTYNIPITFVCEPFMTDIEPREYEYNTKDIKIDYSGFIDGHPIIELYGYGNIQLVTNGETFLIKNVDKYVKIDCELLETIDSNKQSKDWDTIGDYPYFTYGENNIIITGNVTKTKISITNKYL